MKIKTFMFAALAAFATLGAGCSDDENMLYMCICIVFFGAEINYYYSTEENIGVDK